MDIEYNNRILSYYKECITYIEPIGLKIKEKYKFNTPQPILVCNDLLFRIRCNILSLVQLGAINNFNSVAHRIIIRNIHADLILGLYLLTCTDDERADEIGRQNNEAVKSLEQWVISKKEFYENLPKGEPLNIFIDDFYNRYKEYIDETTGKLKSGKGTTIKQLSLRLRGSKILALQKIEQLNTNYKLLSLTEHYHPITRRHSFNFEEDKLILEDFVKWMTAGVYMLTEIAKEWVDTGIFVITET